MNIITKIDTIIRIGMFTNKWCYLMAELGMYNASIQTLTLTHINDLGNEIQCRIYAPMGMLLRELDDIKESIEDGLQCKFEYQIEDIKCFAVAKFNFN